MSHASLRTRPAEAEWERRAKIINAEGEFQAAATLGDVAGVISRNPLTIQLRYLQTLLEIRNEQNSTIVRPLPIDLIGPLMQAVNGYGADAGVQSASEAGIAPDRTTDGPPTGAIGA